MYVIPVTFLTLSIFISIDRPSAVLKCEWKAFCVLLLGMAGKCTRKEQPSAFMTPPIPESALFSRHI